MRALLPFQDSPTATRTPLKLYDFKLYQENAGGEVYVMLEEEPLCPECGYELTRIRVLKDGETGEITIEFLCDGPSEAYLRSKY